MAAWPGQHKQLVADGYFLISIHLCVHIPRLFALLQKSLHSLFRREIKGVHQVFIAVVVYREHLIVQNSIGLIDQNLPVCLKELRRFKFVQVPEHRLRGGFLHVVAVQNGHRVRKIRVIVIFAVNASGQPGAAIQVVFQVIGVVRLRMQNRVIF